MDTVWFQYALRVRYAETDQMGIVYHANYLNWFEIGRTELIRAMGIAYRSLEEKGLYLPVTELDMDFRLPAKYDDAVAIYTRVKAFSSVRLQFESQVRRVPESHLFEPPGNGAHRGEPDGELLVSGNTRHVWVNRSWKPVRIDKEAPELLDLLRKTLPQSSGHGTD